MSEYALILRCVMDTEETVFRDVRLPDDQLLQDTHRFLLSAFGLEEGEMATFYLTDDEWNVLDEIPMFDFEGKGGRSMENTAVGELMDSPGDKIVWVADLFNMRSFLIELLRLEEWKGGQGEVLVQLGDVPPASPINIDLPESDQEEGTELL